VEGGFKKEEEGRETETEPQRETERASYAKQTGLRICRLSRKVGFLSFAWLAQGEIWG